MQTEDKIRIGLIILLALSVALMLFTMCGCSQVIYNPTTREIKVNRIFDDNELSGLEIVFPDGSYVVIDKNSSRTNPESIQMLKALVELGLIKPVPEK